MLRDDGALYEEFESLWFSLREQSSGVASFLQQLEDERFIGPRVFCQTPNGQRDCHGRMVRVPAPGTLHCAFCGRPVESSPGGPYVV